MFLCLSFDVLLSFGVALEKKHRRLGEGPFQIGIADLLARVAVGFTRRFLAAFDKACVGTELLDGGEAVNILNLIKNHQGEYSADPRHRARAK